MRLGYAQIILMLVTCWIMRVNAQVLPFQLYTMRDGLASTLVSSVMQDSRGFLWIGTMDGISVFDGREFHNYTLADGLPFSRVNDIIESKKHPGTMWIATNGGGICK